MEQKNKLTIEEIKKISLDILVDIDKFCNENNITYFLACGTLLGSIKYKDYIPWDDDIDVMMPRPDYERFIEEYHNSDYKVLKPEVGMFFYAKVYDDKTVEYEKGYDYNKYNPIGVSVDIFPLDGIVNDEKIVKKQKSNSDFLEMLLRLSNQPIFYRKNKLKAINRIIPRIIGSKNIVKLIEKNAKKYKYDDCDYVIRYKDTPNGFTGALSKDVYKIKKGIFANREFNIPVGYDLWLRRFYDEDYMDKVPPVEERRQHNKECYYK